MTDSRDDACWVADFREDAWLEARLGEQWTELGAENYKNESSQRTLFPFHTTKQP